MIVLKLLLAGLLSMVQLSSADVEQLGNFNVLTASPDATGREVALIIVPGSHLTTDQYISLGKNISI